ncbi:extracellular solute-binding protein [Rhodococcus fascians]|nr:extracellular solute-binding protein [Rhodococcus fascians]MBY4238720.1 extracellular solute-binding protein [Rhodococcus fascians]MBY4254691.1 extracellular solute-binding protein [Rhodococcus fascians]MBY4270075.1 extracellular solute-binding protein [Rhodococcus fascians]
MTYRVLRVGAALLSTALVVTSCGQAGGTDGSVADVDTDVISQCVDATAPGWDDVVETAGQEGRVVLYTVTLPEINANLERAFEAAYPNIDLQITRVVGEEINASLDAEQSTGTDGADVVSHVNYDWMLDHLDSGAFVEPVGPDSAGPNWMGTENLIDDVFQVSLLTGIGIAWRTDLIETPPTKYMDLLKPEYSNGQVGIVNAEAQSLADLYAWMEDEFGPDYLPQLAAQQPRVYASAVPTLEALIAGEISVDGFASSIGVAAAKAKGAPIEFALPDPGWAPLNLSYMLSKSARPNASQVLFNFMACDAGQEALAQNNVSVLDGIPGTIGSPDSVTAANLSRMTEPGWIQRFYPQWAEIFGR